MRWRTGHRALVAFHASRRPGRWRRDVHTSMKAQHLLLLVVLLSGVAADVPPPPFSAEERTSIETIVRRYRPEGLFTSVTAQLKRGPLPDMAVVRLTTRRGERDEIVCVLTLKKDGKEWKVESCAR